MRKLPWNIYSAFKMIDLYVIFPLQNVFACWKPGQFFFFVFGIHLYFLNLVLCFKLCVDPIYNDWLINLIWFGTNPSKPLQLNSETGRDSGKSFLKLVKVLIKKRVWETGEFGVSVCRDLNSEHIHLSPIYVELFTCGINSQECHGVRSWLPFSDLCIRQVSTLL